MKMMGRRHEVLFTCCSRCDSRRDRRMNIRVGRKREDREWHRDQDEVYRREDADLDYELCHSEDLADELERNGAR